MVLTFDLRYEKLEIKNDCQNNYKQTWYSLKFKSKLLIIK